MTVPYPSDPTHQPFLPCVNENCVRRAVKECSDCFLQHCQECIDTQQQLSDPYFYFLECSHQYTCIYCFINLQYKELNGTSII